MKSTAHLVNVARGKYNKSSTYVCIGRYITAYRDKYNTSYRGKHVTLCAEARATLEIRTMQHTGVIVILKCLKNMC